MSKGSSGPQEGGEPGGTLCHDHARSARRVAHPRVAEQEPPAREAKGRDVPDPRRLHIFAVVQCQIARGAQPLGSKRDAEAVSGIMRKVRSTNTMPELVFRRALWEAGVRYRLHDKSLPGAPDIVSRRNGLVIFVDGDFWHGRQWQVRGFKSLEAQSEDCPSRGYWAKKVLSNARRQPRITMAFLGTVCDLSPVRCVCEEQAARLSPALIASGNSCVPTGKSCFLYS